MVINLPPASGQSWRSDGSLDSVCVEITQVPPKWWRWSMPGSSIPDANWAPEPSTNTVCKLGTYSIDARVRYTWDLNKVFLIFWPDLYLHLSWSCLQEINVQEILHIHPIKSQLYSEKKMFRHKVVRSSNQSELISIVWFAGFHLLLYLLLVFFYYLLLVWKTMVAMVMVMIRTVMKTRRTMTSHFTHSPTMMNKLAKLKRCVCADQAQGEPK